MQSVLKIGLKGGVGRGGRVSVQGIVHMAAALAGCSVNSLGQHYMAATIWGRYTTWTLDSGLDHALDYGLDYGLNFGPDSVPVLQFNGDIECWIAQ